MAPKNLIIHREEESMKKMEKLYHRNFDVNNHIVSANDIYSKSR